MVNTPVPSTPVSTPVSTSIGSGSDKLVLKISEDAYKGDAQYTISVDGKQVDGTLTAHASHAANQSETITVNGDWASGNHQVSINFLNDTYEGSASADRNLYLDNATYNGADVSGSKISLTGGGAQGFWVHDTAQVSTPPVQVPVPSTPVSTPVSTSIGSGSDKLVLKISEDAYKGDAQYTISVDGKQVDGTLTAHASHAANQSETITVNGDWASGNHQVSINFLNDTYEGSASADRNLYLDNATYNGADVSGSKISLTGGGAQGFWVHDTAQVSTPPVQVPVPSTPVSTPVSTSIGSGSDKLVLKISEDAYKGDAQYTISVDGKQVDGTLTAHASHAANQSETITVNGDWASGNHQVSINFLNDTYEGSASADRNLYLDNATYNGADVSGSKISLTGGGAQGFWVHDTAQVSTPPVQVPVPSTPVSTPVSTSIGSGSDKLVLKISEDAYKGDAQYTISVDGKQVDGTLTAHASHAANQSETITVNGDWASGNHQVSINFLNDTYEGSASADRNLYLDNATYNGADVSGSKISLTGGGAQGFWVHDLG